MESTELPAARRIFEDLAGGPLPGWDRLRPGIRAVALAPGETLFRTGDPHPFIYCVHHGLLKLVYDTADGTEWVKAFSCEGLFFASIAALQPGGRASFSVTALEASRLERVEYARLLQLAAEHPVWQATLRRGFEIYGARKEERERELLTLSAERRFRLFQTQYPQLDGRIPQKDLARYLGVTPVGLSRIKARVARSSDAPPA